MLRLRGDYLAIVTLGFAEVVRALVNNLDKPINLTNGPKGISPITKPPLFFEPLLEFFGIQVADATLYPLYFYFLILIMVFTSFSLPDDWKTRGSAGRGKRFARTKSPRPRWACRSCA